MSTIAPATTATLTGRVLEGALLYSVAFDSIASRLTVTIECDPDWHTVFLQALPFEPDDSGMVDLVFSGVSSFSMTGIGERPKEWRDDEKPHNCEIAFVKVKTLRLYRRGEFRLTIDFHLRQKLEIRATGLSMQRSARPPGTVHSGVAQGLESEREPG